MSKSAPALPITAGGNVVTVKDGIYESRPPSASAFQNTCAHVRKGATLRGVMCRDCRQEWLGEEGQRVWKAMHDAAVDELDDPLAAGPPRGEPK